MEEDIDKEMELDLQDGNRSKGDEDIKEEKPRAPPVQKVPCDFKSLDEMVRKLIYNYYRLEQKVNLQYNYHYYRW